MSDCCVTNAPPGGCRQGRDCPVNAARAARTCEALGICQHPERECVGACEQVPRVPADPDLSGPLQMELARDIRYWFLVGVIALGSLVVICGVAGYLYVRWHL